MKPIITLKPVRYNGENRPAGDVFCIEDDLYSIWIDLGLAKDYTDAGLLISDETPGGEPENEPERHIETENNLKIEDSIKSTKKPTPKSIKKKGQVKKDAKNI